MKIWHEICNFRDESKGKLGRLRGCRRRSQRLGHGVIGVLRLGLKKEMGLALLMGSGCGCGCGEGDEEEMIRLGIRIGFKIRLRII